MSHEASGNRAIKAHYLLGLARVDLHELVFTPAISRGHRESSDKLKTRLITVYELEGCRRFEEENFIDAKIDADDLNVALQKANLTISALKEKSHKDLCNPEQISRLKFQRGLSCLNGLHRVRAAQTFLDPNDRWWIVRLYSQENFDNDLSTRLLESYGNEQSYTDGIIFRHIRRYHIDGDEVNENRWWARLTLTKRKDLRQLCKNRLLIEAFDRLIPFPGLWTPIQLGTLHRLHGLRCPEVCLKARMKAQNLKDVGASALFGPCLESLEQNRSYRSAPSRRHRYCELIGAFRSRPIDGGCLVRGFADEAEENISSPR